MFELQRSNNCQQYHSIIGESVWLGTDGSDKIDSILYDITQTYCFLFPETFKRQKSFNTDKYDRNSKAWKHSKEMCPYIPKSRKKERLIWCFISTYDVHIQCSCSRTPHSTCLNNKAHRFKAEVSLLGGSGVHFCVFGFIVV